MISKETKKLVVIDSKGSITELGGISGPVINPCSLPVETIVKLINGHKKVYEVNPANKKERLRLNLKNVKMENFPKKANPVITANLAPESKKTTQDTTSKGNDKTTTKSSEKTTKSDFTKK